MVLQRRDYVGGGVLGADCGYESIIEYVRQIRFREVSYISMPGIAFSPCGGGQERISNSASPNVTSDTKPKYFTGFGCAFSSVRGSLGMLLCFTFAKPSVDRKIPPIW